MACDLIPYKLARIPIKKPWNGYYLRWYFNGWHYWFFQPGKYSIISQGEKYYTLGTRKIIIGTGIINLDQSYAIKTIMLTREVYLLTNAGWMHIRTDSGSLNIYNNQVGGTELEFSIYIGSKEISYQTGYSPVPGDGSVPEIPVVPPDTSYCEITMNDQIWMCKVFDSAFPGSKVYDDDEDSRAVYGGLYTYNQIMTPGFCPAGWHIPTLAEWQKMLTYISADQGGALKEIGTTHWNAPNTGAVDTYGFALKPGGRCDGSIFSMLGLQSIMWTADETALGYTAYQITLQYNSAGYSLGALDKTVYASVLLLKDEVAPATEVVIGTQTWKTANVDDNIVGSRVYNNDEANRPLYGGLYNQSMVAAIEALYPGWHVPTKAEFDTLRVFLGGTFAAGGPLKETGLTYWNAPNTGATNSAGFYGRAGGSSSIGFSDLGIHGNFWSKTLQGGALYYFGQLHNDSADFDTSNAANSGVYLSVRLIKD